MKKILLLSFAALTQFSFAQSFNAYVINMSGIKTATVTNGSTFNETTSTGATTTTRFNLENKTALTHTFSVIRTVIYHSPTLALDGLGSSPDSYFMFGSNVLASNVNTPSSSDYIILGPAGSSTVPFDNNYDNSQMFISYVDEGTSQGDYIVKYKVYNVSSTNDTLSFDVNYNNALVGVKELTSFNEQLNIYPNPSSANISVNIPSEFRNAAVSVKNILGEEISGLVSQKQENVLHIDCHLLAKGIYSLSLTDGNKRLSGKFTLVK